MNKQNIVGILDGILDTNYNRYNIVLSAVSDVLGDLSASAGTRTHDMFFVYDSLLSINIWWKGGIWYVETANPVKNQQHTVFSEFSAPDTPSPLLNVLLSEIIAVLRKTDFDSLNVDEGYVLPAKLMFSDTLPIMKDAIGLAMGTNEYQYFIGKNTTAATQIQASSVGLMVALSPEEFRRGAYSSGLYLCSSITLPCKFGSALLSFYEASKFFGLLSYCKRADQKILEWNATNTKTTKTGIKDYFANKCVEVPRHDTSLITTATDMALDYLHWSGNELRTDATLLQGIVDIMETYLILLAVSTIIVERLNTLSGMSVSVMDNYGSHRAAHKAIDVLMPDTNIFVRIENKEVSQWETLSTRRWQRLVRK